VFWLKTQSMTITGSLHTTIDKRQNEDETVAVNRVLFSTAMPVMEFNDISPNKIWVGEHDDVQFAFTRSESNSDAAGIFHYIGNAVYPAFSNMLINNGDQLSAQQRVVSNSLPMWLSLLDYTPIWLNPPNPLITLYPSYAVPDNLPPPYGVVHILPGATRALQAIPRLGPVAPMGNAALGTLNGTTSDSTHWQLTSDRVQVTLYGLTNDQALDWQDLVLRYSRDLDTIGIMSAGVMRDEKRTQPEMGLLAMKKAIDFEVSYYQNRANDTAQQLIESVTVAFFPQDY